MTDIIEKLDSLHLTPLQKRLLRDELDKELSRKGATDFSDWEMAVWEAVCQVLHIRMTLDTFLDRFRYTKRDYGNDVFQVEQFVREHCGELTKIQRMTVLATIMRCINYLLVEEDEGRVRPQDLLSNIHYIGQAVEDQFPGYAEAGILRSALIAAPLRG